MEMTALDSLLLLQLTVARLGEKELLGWWNTDIVYKLGGADFLNRLVGSTFAPLAAGEAVLMAARMKEEQGLAAIPGESAYTLFCPEPRLRSELTHRFRHFKTYPDDVPAEIREILDSERQWKAPDLFARLGANPKPSFQGTSFGREVSVHKAWTELEKARALAATLSPEDKGSYVMPYYRSGDAS